MSKLFNVSDGLYFKKAVFVDDIYFWDIDKFMWLLVRDQNIFFQMVTILRKRYFLYLKSIVYLLVVK